ncbi:MAG: hypothetical protein AAF609_08495 [Cyanobacteria bacterium P01_C01_bin.120]
MSQTPENPNAATLQTGLGRSSRRTGNRIDRLAERAWITRQSITFPYGPVAIAISVARTYYIRALLFGLLYLAAQYGVIVPGSLMFTLGAAVLWELVLGAYLWASGAPKFDLMTRITIALVSIVLVYEHLYSGICNGSF